MINMFLMSSNQYRHAFGVALLTLAIYILTIHPLTQPYGFHLLLISSITGLTLLLFRRFNHTLVIYSALTTLLLTVGITGWFFSPFFSWLYIAAIALSFILDTWASYAFSYSFSRIRIFFWLSFKLRNSKMAVELREPINDIKQLSY